MKRELHVCVERDDGSTFEQEISWREDEGIRQALDRYEGMLGDGYEIVEWWARETGERRAK